MKTELIKLEIQGMTCDHCANHLIMALDLQGIVSKEVSYPDSEAVITYDTDLINKNEIIDTIHNETNYKVIKKQRS